MTTQTLTQMTIDADGTNSGVIRSDDLGTPLYAYCNDAPDGLSADFIENDDTETTGTIWFRLENVDSDFVSMLSLNIDVDVQAIGFVDDTCKVTARIFDADNDTSNPLTDETGNLATESDTTRTQRNVVFSNLKGTKTEWNNAYIRLTWTYVDDSTDNANIRLFGLDIDGTYSDAAIVLAGQQWNATAAGPYKVDMPSNALTRGKDDSPTGIRNLYSSSISVTLYASGSDKFWDVATQTQVASTTVSVAAGATAFFVWYPGKGWVPFV